MVNSSDFIPMERLSKEAPTQKLDSLLQKGGFQVTPDIVSNIHDAIEKNPNLWESMEQDIPKTLSDPKEKSRFETMYLKGFGQVVDIGGRKMSFIEIAGLPDAEKEDILDNKISVEQSKLYLEWQQGRKKVANQTERKIDENIQVANQTERKIDELRWAANEKISKDLVQKARSLVDPTANAFVDQGVKEIQSDPEKSPITQNLLRQGASIEDIKSGKLNSTIEAYVISQNETTLAPKDPEKAKEFQKVVSEMRSTLGILPVNQKSINMIAESKVLGPGRDAIVSSMQRVAETRKYDRMGWDADTRQVVFYGKGEKYIIDTAHIPPREAIEIRGLSIVRKTPPANPDLQEKKRLEEKDGRFRGLLWERSIELNKKLITEEGIPEAMKKPVYQGKIDAHKQAKEEYQKSKNPNESLEAIKKLKITNHDLEQTRKQSMSLNTIDDPTYTTLEDQLFYEMDELSQMEAVLGQFLKNEQEKKKYEGVSSPTDNFDSTARKNLEWLTNDENLFHRMGPRSNEALTRMIDEINKNRSVGNRINLAQDTLGRGTDTSGPALKKILEKVQKAFSYNPRGENSYFERELQKALSYPPSHPLSIESHINGTYEQVYKN